MMTPFFMLIWLVTTVAENSKLPPVILPICDNPLNANNATCSADWSAEPEVTPPLGTQAFTVLSGARVVDGDLLILEIKAPAKCLEPVIRWQGATFKTYPVAQDFRHALLPVPLGSDAGCYLLEVDCLGNVTTWQMCIDNGQYPQSQLRVDSKFTRAPPAQVVQEQATFAAALTHSESQRLWIEPFIKPTQGITTSPYGVRRTFNGQLKSRHLGEDFDGQIGELLWAANDGMVVLAAQNYFYIGNAVVIDHGQELYTMYFHLSELQVQTGDRVSRGQIIGKIGRSGRVTGPHLHFAVKLAGVYLNPESLLRYDSTTLLPQTRPLLPTSR